jgi:hypothetical protein
VRLAGGCEAERHATRQPTGGAGPALAGAIREAGRALGTSASPGPARTD